MAISYNSNNNRRRRRRHYGEKPILPPLNLSPSQLLKNLISLAQTILDLNPNPNSRTAAVNCQGRNITVISRRIKIILMLLEELHDSTTASTAPASSSSSPLPTSVTAFPPSAVLCFGELHVVLQGIRLLVEDCAESSRIWLVMEHGRLSEHFHHLTQEMAMALDVLPLSLLDVSCDVHEQVELVRKQARNAKMFVDPRESQLWADVMSVMAQIERKGPTPTVSTLSEIFKRLDLNSASDCQTELEKLEAEEHDTAASLSEAPSRRRTENLYRIRVPFNDLLSFVRYGKCVLYGATELREEAGIDQEFDDDESAAVDDEIVKVPEDFRCPISLELMMDPVIVSSGQTYDRASIARWMEEGGNRTCPKSGLKLSSDNALIPNYALRSLILQWCASNNIRVQLAPAQAPSKNHSDATSSPTALEATKLTAEFLLRQLPSASPDTQRHIAAELRFLTKSGNDNRKLMAEAGAIPALIPLLSSRDPKTQEHAVTAILNLSIFHPNKALIVEAGALAIIVQMLQESSCTESTSSNSVKESAAATLFSLSQVEDYAAMLGEKTEALKGLMKLCREAGSQRGRRDAVSAIYNIAVYQPNRGKLAKAGAVSELLALLSSSTRTAIEEEAVAVLAILANSSEGRAAMVMETEALRILMKLIQSGSPQTKENAAAILVQLCRTYGDQSVVHRQGSGFHIHEMLQSLHSLLIHGTPRGRRKANSLLRIFLKLESANSVVPTPSTLSY